MSEPRVTIVCPCYNEERFIVECIESILDQEYPAELLEYIFVDGASTDRTVELIEGLTEKNPRIRLLHNPERIVPISMNMGIRAARGEYVVRIDAHAEYPKAYIKKLIEWSERLPDAANVGTPCVTKAREESARGLAIAEVLANRFGVGNSIFRIGTEELRVVDTVPFGCFRREVFEKYGYYDERLPRMQDLELNKRIIRQGGKVYLIPDCQCTYYARSTYRSLMKTHYDTGKWNMLAVKLTSHVTSLGWRHYIPLVFVLTLPLSIWPYLLVDSVVSARVAVRKGLSFGSLWSAFLLLHVSHGAGQVAAIWEIIFGKLK